MEIVFMSTNGYFQLYMVALKMIKLIIYEATENV